MTNDKTGGPAFPQRYRVSGESTAVGGTGMTLWDWYAGHALSGVLNDPRTVAVCVEVSTEKNLDPGDVIARTAASVADAMIAERKKRGIA